MAEITLFASINPADLPRAHVTFERQLTVLGDPITVLRVHIGGDSVTIHPGDAEFAQNLSEQFRLTADRIREFEFIHIAHGEV